MTIEFTKAHTTKDGRSYVQGQIAELDPGPAQELIRAGVAKERKGTAGERGETLEGGERTGGAGGGEK